MLPFSKRLAQKTSHHLFIQSKVKPRPIVTRSCTSSHGSYMKLTYLSNHVKSSLCFTSAAMCLYLWTSFGPHFFTSFFCSSQLLQPDSGVWCSSVWHREPDGRDSNLSCPWFFLSGHHNSAFFRLLHVCALFQLTCISVQNLFGTSFSLKTLSESKEFLVGRFFTRMRILDMQCWTLFSQASTKCPNTS